jgi:drug/metabolite transporter (DMT)-like permease
MMLLFSCIALNAFVGIVFKLFQRFGISNLQAIVVNYFVCVITGCVYLQKNPFTVQNFQQDYALYALIMGGFFFSVFVAISKSVVLNGVSTTTVANKLSLIIPVIVAYFYYSDSIHMIKWLGIAIAIAAVWFASQSGTSAKASKNAFVLPLIIFLGSGFLDSATNIIQSKLPDDDAKETYLIFCFGSAAVLSVIYLCFQIWRGKEKFQTKSFGAGIFLGIPNYFSILTFISALQSGIMQTSALIPVINIAVVLVSTIAVFIFFKERLNKSQILGIALSICAIACIILGDNFGK